MSTTTTTTTPTTNNPTLSRDHKSKEEITRILNLNENIHWQVLRLPIKFTAEDVTTKYRDISLLVHPDKAPVGMEEESRLAFVALNKAKELLSNPEGLKHWQQLVAAAEKDVQAQKLPELTKKKQDVLKKNNVAGWDKVSFTVEELEKIGTYYEWVVEQVKHNVIQEEWRKRQLARQRQEHVEDVLHDEEARAKFIKTIEGKAQQVEQTQGERAQSWRNFSAKNTKHRAATNFKLKTLLPQQQDFVAQRKQIDDRLKLASTTKPPDSL